MCEPFIYGGCLGNKNNFVDRNECLQTCQKYGSWPQVCTLPKEEGPCKGAIPRFYFNFYGKRCTEFRYSGCGGNKNNFASKKDCIGTCRAFKEN
ncbi:kappaPI-actitoxin-Avd3a-like [Sceloporus undulatus]|uniref:kappaPI-actitoxin-Avd3a-like n=1 Tax=Sceloporus undulatus TaxID=8520 RepID=UPI001C4DC5F8|nr:kappaPI-actitoxin-Avd3a-like [Sceloporus undulatus]